MDELTAEQKVKCWDLFGAMMEAHFAEDPFGSGLALRLVIEGIEAEVIKGDKNGS